MIDFSIKLINDNIGNKIIKIDNNGNLYTKETILNLINSISKNQYTNIEYIERF